MSEHAVMTDPSALTGAQGEVLWLEDVGQTDVALVGGKGANLGELTRAGFPVPPGFVVTAAAYVRAMKEGDRRDALLHRASSVDVDDPTALAEAARDLQESVRRAGMPDDLRRAIVGAYRHLGADEPVAVAVRSSATAEDSASTSFAGMNETFTDVRSEDAVVARIVDCWASLWGERVVAYRATQHMTDEPAIAVVVHRMVPAERSGVLFTADPATGDRSRLVIEAALGLGEVVGGGQVEPDTYVIAKDGPHLLDEHIGVKTHKIEPGPDGDHRVALSAEEGQARVLDQGALMVLARFGIEVERHYGAPQDIEFAIDGHHIWLVQSRPITTLGATPDSAEPGSDPADQPRVPASAARVLVTGLAAAPGVAAGPVRVLRSPTEANRLAAGEILVAPMTNPDWVPTMCRAAALVTDGGGVTCHAAIVGRELHLPTIVATRTATAVLHDGDIVTVDGTTGQVLEGRASMSLETVPSPERPAAPITTSPAALPTGTLLYVTLAITEHAEEIAAQPVDGVGLLRPNS
jgi:pyruvate, water dikinase